MRTIELDASDFVEASYRLGWSDGLPVVAPTVDLVDAMLAATPAAGDGVLGTVLGRTVLVQNVAVNAVLAGCAAAYFPLVLAGVSAILDPEFNLGMVATSTAGPSICLVASGPGASAIGMNGGSNALGNGNRANATIGRAIQLVMRNVLGVGRDRPDLSTLGSPGKYSLCFAEPEPETPWPPLRVERGYGPADTTITVMATECPRQIANHRADSSSDLLTTFACGMSSPSSYYVGRGAQAVVVFGPEHAGRLMQAGLTKADVRAELASSTKVAVSELEAAGISIETGTASGHRAAPDGKLVTFHSPDDIFVVAAGGPGGGWSAYMPSWSWNTRAVTVSVNEFSG